MQTDALKFGSMVWAMFFMAFAHATQSIDDDSRLLAECEFSYSYAGQLMKLSDNEGAAKNMLFRSTLMTTTNFFRNAEEQSVPGWKTEQFKKIRDPLKRKFDSNPNEALIAAARCDAKTSRLVRQEMAGEKTFWGKSFNDLHTEMFRAMLFKLGLL